MAAQRADRKSMIGQLALEILDLALVLKHRELAVRVAGIVAIRDLLVGHDCTIVIKDLKVHD